MIVVDASAVVDLVAVGPFDPALRDRILLDGDLHAPHLVDVEVVQALRRLVATGELTADRAGDARVDAAELRMVRYPHLALVERAWELRENLSIYDGVYVALAELLGVPLVTCAARMATAQGHDAVVEVFAPAT
jgi:predicted nucleic acid-binding protein